MSTTKTGWTDEFPEVEEGLYFSRHKLDHEEVDVGRLRDRSLLFTNVSRSKARRKDFEYLGPFTAQDFEQLAALRKAANEFVDAYKGKEHQLGNGQALKSYLRFRELAQGEKWAY